MVPIAPDDGDHAEIFWESVLQAIDSERLVPVIGREALVFDTPDGTLRLDQILARRLAAANGTDVAALPPDFDLNDVIVGADGFHGTMPTPTAVRIFQLLRALESDIPETLRLLAAIPKLRLFVTLTFDALMENALREIRGSQPAVGAYPTTTARYADLDPAQPASPAGTVFHLLGRRSVTPNDFTVTEGQILEALHNVMSATNRPIRLIERLQASNLLLLGLGLPDWPARFLVRMARPGPLWAPDRNTSEMVAQASLDGLPMFLHRFSPDRCLALPTTPLAFARELHRRWFERFPPAATGQSLDPAGEGTSAPAGETAQEAMMTGAVFISYARENREQAFRLADALDDGGIEVWIDRRLNPGDDYQYRIREHIKQASAFVAVLSAQTIDPTPRWYRREWQLACTHNEQYFLTGKGFIYPVIIDDTTSRDHDVTLGSFATQSARAPGGTPDAGLIRSLVFAQRAWRRARAS